jgi:hypothetical protein
MCRGDVGGLRFVPPLILVDGCKCRLRCAALSHEKCLGFARFLGVLVFLLSLGNSCRRRASVSAMREAIIRDCRTPLSRKSSMPSDSLIVIPLALVV